MSTNVDAFVWEKASIRMNKRNFCSDGTNKQIMCITEQIFKCMSERCHFKDKKKYLNVDAFAKSSIK